MKNHNIIAALLSSKLKNQPKKKYAINTKNFWLTKEANKIKVIMPKQQRQSLKQKKEILIPLQNGKIVNSVTNIVKTKVLMKKKYCNFLFFNKEEKQSTKIAKSKYQSAPCPI